MLTLDPEQQEAVDKMASEPTRGALNASDTGCIQGDAELVINRGGKSFRITLKDLVHMFNGGERGRWGKGYRWDENIPTRVQRRAQDGSIRLVDIVGAWYSGQKMTYTVVTTSGKSIRATDEHPFYTEHGWKRLDELKEGGRVWVTGDQQSGRPRKPKNYYLYRTKLKFHPYARSTKNLPNLCRVATHRLVVEADMNGLTLNEYITALRTGEGVERFKFLHPEQAVHHKDRDHKNNTLENLEVCESQEEHARLHSEDFQRHVLYKTRLETITSITPYGTEDTYDIEVADDPHNFIANGFVVHNTGKTLMAVELAKKIGAKSVLVVGPASPKVIDSWRRTFEMQEFGAPFTKLEKKTYEQVDYERPAPGVYYVSKEFAMRHDSLGDHERDIPWAKSRFDLVIADESHFATNRKAKTTKTMWRFRRAGYRLALSATPQGSNFAGFWALCRFLWYNVLREGATEDTPIMHRYIIDSSYQRWEAVWCELETVYLGDRSVQKVTGPKEGDPAKFTKTLPCYIHISKEELPTHTRLVDVTLTDEQRRIYDELLESAVVWLDENNVLVAEYPMVKRIRLKQATLGFPIFNDEEELSFDFEQGSPKADAVRAIRKLHAGEKVVVYTTSEKFTRLLKDREPDAVLWTGPVSKKQREKNMDEFINGNADCLIATYPAIAEGTDGMQFASNIEVWVDEPDSAVISTQVAGRLNRRGQPRDHIIRYKLLAEDTTDTEQLEKMIEKVRARRSEL